MSCGQEPFASKQTRTKCVFERRYTPYRRVCECVRMVGAHMIAESYVYSLICVRARNDRKQARKGGSVRARNDRKQARKGASERTRNDRKQGKEASERTRNDRKQARKGASERTRNDRKQ